jgi:hypothetical protein
MFVSKRNNLYVGLSPKTKERFSESDVKDVRGGDSGGSEIQKDIKKQDSMG